MGLLLQDLNSMVRTSMSIEREVDDAWNIRDAGVVKDKRKESQPSSFGSGKKIRLLLRKGFKDMATIIRAKAKVVYLQVVDIIGFTASQGRGHVTIATNLDI